MRRWALVFAWLLVQVSLSEAANLTFAWDASTDDVAVTGYRIYYRIAPAAYILANSVDMGNALTGTVTGLTAATLYYFCVTAHDVIPNEGVCSQEIGVVTGPTTPTAPTFLRQSAMSCRDVRLRWNPSFDDLAVTQYRVRRDAAQIGTTGNPATTAATVSYLPLDDGSGTTADDRSTTNVDGTLCQGATCPAQTGMWVPGPRSAPVLHCDGVDDRVNIAHTAAHNVTGDLTLSFWLRLLSTTNLATNATVGAKDDAVSPFSTPWAIVLKTPGDPTLQYWHHAAAGDFSAFLDFTTYTVPVNTWAFVTVVRTVSNRTVRLYINGVDTQALTWTAADDPGTNTKPTMLCVADDLLSTHYAHVELSEWRLLNVALNAGQVQTLWASSQGPVRVYDDTGLSPSTAYTYVVRAADAAGNESGDSNSVVLTTPACP
jgi:hypothetical protein